MSLVEDIHKMSKRLFFILLNGLSANSGWMITLRDAPIILTDEDAEKLLDTF